MLKKENKYQELLKYIQTSIVFKLWGAYSISTHLSYLDLHKTLEPSHPNSRHT